MRDLIRLILKNSFVLLFLLYEGIAFLLIFQYNPFQHSRFMGFSRNITADIYDKLEGVRSYLYLKEENEELLYENTRLRNRLSEKTDYFVIRKDSLGQDSVSVDKPSQFTYIPAKVINNSTNKQFNYITINKGTEQGVSKDMGVISEGGVVGIVSDASENFATVIPILNRNFRLSGKLAKNNYFGILEWRGRGTEYVNLREIPIHVDIQKGDTVVTSGYSAIFPGGILVGVIEEFKVKGGNFYEITVRLASDFQTLYYLNVIRNEYAEEINKLEEEEGYD